MARQYTQQELQAFQDADIQLHQLGLDFYDRQKAERNGDVVFQYFEANPTISVTWDSIKEAALGPLKTELYWKSAAVI
jgi:hypothetical protein